MILLFTRIPFFLFLYISSECLLLNKFMLLLLCFFDTKISLAILLKLIFNSGNFPHFYIKLIRIILLFTSIPFVFLSIYILNVCFSINYVTTIMFFPNQNQLIFFHKSCKYSYYIILLIAHLTWSWVTFLKNTGHAIWNAVRDFITFILFVRLCMEFNTFFVFIKLSFSKIILTSYNFANIILPAILYKTLSTPSFKNAFVLKRVYLNQLAQKLCLEHFWRHSNRVTVFVELIDNMILKKENILKTPSNKY